jgi:hypothetical protein
VIIFSHQALGEIFSLAVDRNHVLTGHTLSNSAFKLWSGQDLSELKVKTTFEHVLTGHTLSNSAFKLWSGQDLSELKVKTTFVTC